MLASHKRQLLAIAVVIIVIGAAALGLVLTKFELGQMAEPNLHGNSTESTPSLTIPTPTATIPTQSPPSTSTPLPISTATPTPSPAKSSNGNLQLTISLEKTVYSVWEPVNITLAIVNISNQTVDFTYTGMNFDFLVQNDTKNLIYQWSIGRAFAMFIMIKPLQPGENVTATYTWPQTCNSNPSTLGAFVSSGTYYIIGKSNSIYGLQTNPVQIVIGNS